MLYLQKQTWLFLWRGNLPYQACSKTTLQSSQNVTRKTVGKLYLKHLQSAIQINFIIREGNKACATPSFPGPVAHLLLSHKL